MLCFFKLWRKKPKKQLKDSITVVPNSFVHVDSFGRVCHGESAGQIQKAMTVGSNCHPGNLQSNGSLNKHISVTGPLESHPIEHLELPHQAQRPQSRGTSHDKLCSDSDKTNASEKAVFRPALNDMSNSKHFKRRPVSESLS